MNPEPSASHLYAEMPEIGVADHVPSDTLCGPSLGFTGLPARLSARKLHSGDVAPRHSEPNGIEQVQLAPPRRDRKQIALSLAIGVAVIIIGLMIYWHFRGVHGFSRSVTAYVPVLFPSLIALGTIIFKDWSNYKPKGVRWVLIAIVLLAAAGGVYYQSIQRAEKIATTALNQANIDSLKGQISSAQQAQTNNTKEFLGSLGKLSDKVADLQTKAATEELKKKMAIVQTELEDTRKALVQPKATLIFTFDPYKNPTSADEFVPVTETTLPLNADGSVHIEFSVVNATEAAASDGELTFQICDQCKFLKQPAGFKSLPGQSASQINMPFDRLLPLSSLSSLAADVIPPTSTQAFRVQLIFRCKTCTLIKSPPQAVVHIAR
jgi:hypothetical protein